MGIVTDEPPSVLVVDDDDELRDVLIALLEVNGYRAVGAGDGAEALALLRDGARPSLIVFDLMMPRKTGLEFRAEQLGDPALAGIPAVAMSAAVQGESMRKALQVDELLTKPLDVDALLALVARHCQRTSP
jgi:CheY-like chemotaxis protein